MKGKLLRNYGVNSDGGLENVYICIEYIRECIYLYRVKVIYIRE